MQKPRGTKDIVGFEARLRAFAFKVLEKVSMTFNFARIEVPIFETEAVFKHSMGATSDVVTKEMYRFLDKSNRVLVLRPEGTAGVVRAVVENKLYAQPLPLRFFYLGPMFRYENPQRGRQRQFTQYGVEVFGPKSPYLDAELILMAGTILDALKISYTLKLNSLGDKATRDAWSNALRNYFKKHQTKLEPHSLQRLTTNPARILDDKVEMEKSFVQQAPLISDFYSPAAKTYFTSVCDFLKDLGIKFVVEPNLVRGFDYYTDVVFEFLPRGQEANSQSTLIGGGRYDHLVQQFGGPDLPGAGFALGIERLTTEMQHIHPSNFSAHPGVYVVNIDATATSFALSVTYLLRRAGFHTAWNYRPKRLNKALEKADKTKASVKVIVGAKELAAGMVVVKSKTGQQQVLVDNLVETMHQVLAKEGK